MLGKVKAFFEGRVTRLEADLATEISKVRVHSSLEAWKVMQDSRKLLAAVEARVASLEARISKFNSVSDRKI
jgi:hypothetical protein